ncbi:hypothetical protein [Nocardioides caricicola]|uniref:Uncharacterized protein n=1 Tax=Nocardioides caricicola TaxID=634770 RepID=A0ABW0MYT0_9ACTN
MNTLTGGLLATLLALPLVGCSSDAAEPEPAPASEATEAAEVTDLEALWTADLLVPPNGTGGVDAVSQGYFIGAGSMDSSPGTTNPTPNVALDYGIGDAGTGEVVSMAPLSGMPGTVESIPGTDLFVAVAPAGWEIVEGRPRITGHRIGVVDPATASFLWTRRSIGSEVLGMSATRIYLGHDTPKGRPICFAVDDGTLTRDAACRDSMWTKTEGVDGVTWSANERIVDLPTGEQVTIPVTQAQDEASSEQLWTYGDTSAWVEGGDVGYETSTFARSDLGLVRVDYTYSGTDPYASNTPEAPWPDAVLRLVDPRTGEVTRTLGQVRSGTLVGFAGDIAIFEHAGATGLSAAGYRVTV